jgi:hypothetical protein
VFEGVEVRIVVVATVVPGAPADIVAIVTSLVEVREGVGARIVVVTSLVITSEVAKAPANVVAIVTSVAEVGEWARVVVRITVVEVGEGATEGTARVGVVVVTISEVVPPARPTKLVVLEAMDPIAEESLTMGLGAGVAASVVGAGMGAVFVIGVLESVVDNASEVVGVLRSTVAAYVEVVSIVASVVGVECSLSVVVVVVVVEVVVVDVVVVRVTGSCKAITSPTTWISSRRCLTNRSIFCRVTVSATSTTR